MERNAVVSTSLESVGYDPQTQTLEIEFRSGEIYDYFDVPVGVYQDLMHADSHGQFFSENIRDVYAYRHVSK